MSKETRIVGVINDGTPTRGRGVGDEDSLRFTGAEDVGEASAIVPGQIVTPPLEIIKNLFVEGHDTFPAYLADPMVLPVAHGSGVESSKLDAFHPGL